MLAAEMPRYAVLLVRLIELSRFPVPLVCSAFHETWLQPEEACRTPSAIHLDSVSKRSPADL